jgi:hypothetical protein
MTQDRVAGVRRHVPDADEAAIKGIVRHCGIALASRDGSSVCCTDKAERDRIRDGILEAKRAPTDRDADPEAAIMGVCEPLAGPRGRIPRRGRRTMNRWRRDEGA